MASSNCDFPAVQFPDVAAAVPPPSPFVPQAFIRLLNTQPLQFSCGSSCIASLLHSTCSQCSGGSGACGCAALQLGTTQQAAECLVDASL